MIGEILLWAGVIISLLIVTLVSLLFILNAHFDEEDWEIHEDDRGFFFISIILYLACFFLSYFLPIIHGTIKLIIWYSFILFLINSLLVIVMFLIKASSSYYYWDSWGYHSAFSGFIIMFILIGIKRQVFVQTTNTLMPIIYPIISQTIFWIVITSIFSILFLIRYFIKEKRAFRYNKARSCSICYKRETFLSFILLNLLKRVLRKDNPPKNWELYWGSYKCFDCINDELNYGLNDNEVLDFIKKYKIDKRSKELLNWLIENKNKVIKYQSVPDLYPDEWGDNTLWKVPPPISDDNRIFWKCPHLKPGAKSLYSIQVPLSIMFKENKYGGITDCNISETKLEFTEQRRISYFDCHTIETTITIKYSFEILELN